MRRSKLWTVLASTPSLLCLVTLILVYNISYRLPPDTSEPAGDHRQQHRNYHGERKIAAYKFPRATGKGGDKDGDGEGDGYAKEFALGDEFEFDLLELDMTRDANDHVRLVKNAVDFTEQEIPVKLQYNRLGLLEREGVHVSMSQGYFHVELGQLSSITGIKPVALPECAQNYRSESSSNLILDTLVRCGTRPKRGDYRLQPELEIWRISQISHCDGRYIMFDREAALLKGVIVDRRLAMVSSGGLSGLSAAASTTGGGLYQLQSGFTRLPCVRAPRTHFRPNNDENPSRALVESLHSYTSPVTVSEVRSNFTFALIRIKYRDFYFTMAEIYNIFLAMHFFSLDAKDVDILFIDAHPNGILDPIWTTLFRTVTPLSKLKEVTFFEQMMWPKYANHSEFLSYRLPYIPYLEELRDFFLNRFSVHDRHKLNCTQLNILVISRADYAGVKTNRKIHNEVELVQALHRKMPTARVLRARLENLHFRDQLELTTKADILVGMHGAGLTHTLFLPKHAGVFEMVPKYWSEEAGEYKAIARWRHLYYTRWRSFRSENEIPGEEFTIVPPDVFVDYVEQVAGFICRERLRESDSV